MGAVDDVFAGYAVIACQFGVGVPGLFMSLYLMIRKVLQNLSQKNSPKLHIT